MFAQTFGIELLLTGVISVFFLLKNSSKSRSLYNCTVAICIIILAYYAFDYAKMFVLNVFYTHENDSLAAIKTSLMSLSAVSIILCIYSYIKNDYLVEHKPDGVFVLILSGLGAFIMIKMETFLGIYMGLELQTIPMYAIIAIYSKKHSDVGIKYFIMSAFSSSILLFGLSLLYINFAQAGLEFTITNLGSELLPVNKLTIIASILTLSGFLFKITIAPMHFWAPNLYSRSNLTVVSFFATVSKTSSFFIVFYYLTQLQPHLGSYTNSILFLVAALACASALIGSTGGLNKKNLHTVFAFSGILNASFVLVTLIFTPEKSYSLITNYLIIYFLLMLGSLFIIARCGVDVRSLNALSEIRKTHPIKAFILTTFILSLAGIPPFGGFFAKYYILFELVANQNYITVAILVTGSVISLGYYLNIIKIMYFDEPAKKITYYTVKKTPFDHLTIPIVAVIFFANMAFVIRPDILI